MNALESYINDKKVDTRFADHLRQIDGRDREQIIKIISHLGPSANTLRALLRLAEEIAQRDSQSLAEVIGDSSISAILSNDKIGRKDRQFKIISALEMKRYPERGRLQARVDANVKRLVRDFGVQVKVPDELEGDTLLISLKARSGEELNEKIASLADIGNHPACREIYAILLGEDEAC